LLSYAEEFLKTALPLLEARAMKSAMVSSVDEMLDMEMVPHVYYSKTYEQAKLEPFVVLHTSGSTGTPRPITLCQQMMCQFDGYHNIAEWEGYTFFMKEWAKRSQLTLMCSRCKPVPTVQVGTS
jgi:acyl-coenzyme A synthetase/AMP-(fatty) acid ligase